MIDATWGSGYISYYGGFVQKLDERYFLSPPQIFGEDHLPEDPRWSLLSSEIEETDDEVVVRVEAPGLQKSDCEVVIEDNMMRISGEKHVEHQTKGSTYHMMERAYGAFHRTFTLPRSVESDKAVASYDNGVLTVRVPKRAGSGGRTVKVE